MKRLVLLPLLLGIVIQVRPAQSDEQTTTGQAQQSIRKAINNYVEAFNRGDAQAIAACWSERGQYTTPDGKQLSGRPAIQEAFAKIFTEHKGLQLEIDQPAIRLEKPDMAIEEGTAIVMLQGNPPRLSRYIATHIKENGVWKILRVEEAGNQQSTPSHHEKLKALAWMVGHWKDQDEQSSVQTVCQWTKNGNFLSRSFAVSIGDQLQLEGTQVIGWDPLRQAIRSWVFDSDGGFGAGIWTSDGDRWIVKQLQILPDGRQASCTNIIRKINDNTCTWQSVGREVEGEILPNVPEVTVVRVMPSEETSAQGHSSSDENPAKKTN